MTDLLYLAHPRSISKLIYWKDLIEIEHDYFPHELAKDSKGGWQDFQWLMTYISYYSSHKTREKFQKNWNIAPRVL